MKKSITDLKKATAKVTGSKAPLHAVQWDAGKPITVHTGKHAGVYETAEDLEAVCPDAVILQVNWGRDEAPEPHDKKTLASHFDAEESE